MTTIPKGALVCEDFEPVQTAGKYFLRSKVYVQGDWAGTLEGDAALVDAIIALNEHPFVGYAPPHVVIEKNAMVLSYTIDYENQPRAIIQGQELTGKVATALNAYRSKPQKAING